MFDYKQQIQNIGGWLTKDEASFLHNTTKNLPSNSIVVEIGSWKGRSTICFGKGLEDGSGGRVYSIDPHVGSEEHQKKFGKVDTYNDFLKNIKGAEIEKYVEPIKDYSYNFVKKFNKEIDFLLIDGAHDYNNVSRDYKQWSKKVKDGGIIAFHDCWQAPGVQLFTSKVLIIGLVNNPKLVDTLTIVEKVQKVKIFERLYNLLFVAYRLLTGWVGVYKIDHYGTVIN